MDKLAKPAIPTIAAIHGPCLAVGWNGALACDYRRCSTELEPSFGLPEIELGLLPAGAEPSGCRASSPGTCLASHPRRKRLKAKDAFRWGLADALAPMRTAA